MKVTYQCSRCGSTSHNDRTFLEGREAPSNIDDTLTQYNTYISQDKTKTFKENEIDAYKRLFSDSLNAKNQRYIKNGHPERCKTILDLYNGKNTCPEEVILQIGNMKDGIKSKDLKLAFKLFAEKLAKIDKERGFKCVQILDAAVHVDEATPHIHMRRVFIAKDKDGYLEIAQNKGLKQAGIPLPHPEQPESRYNNRKMEYDRIMREMWQETCKEIGLEIDTRPKEGRQEHKSVHEFKKNKVEIPYEEYEDLMFLTKHYIKETQEIDAIKEEYEELKKRNVIFNRLIECFPLVREEFEKLYNRLFRNKKIERERTDDYER